MATLANTFHSADNPPNLANLLNTALNTGVSAIAAKIVPTSAADRPVVTETPGKPTPEPEKQLDEDQSQDPVKKYGPIAAIVVALLVVAGLFFKK